MEKGQSEQAQSRSQEQLLVTVSLAITSSKDVDTALSFSLRKICEATDIKLADAWLYSHRTETMDFRTAYFVDNKGINEYVKISKEIKFKKGEGLPGIVLKTKNALWISNVDKESSFLRKEAARRANIYSALAIPIPLNGEVIASLCFYYTEEVQQDEELTRILTVVAGQLGLLLHKKQIEVALRESEKRFRSVIESSHEAIILSDQQGRIIYINKGGENMFGYPAADIMFKPLTVLMPESGQKAYEANIGKLPGIEKDHEIGKILEMRALRKNKEEFPIEMSVSYWETEEETYFSRIIRDISKRKAEEKKLEQLTYELRDVNRKLEAKALERARELSRSAERFYSLAEALNEMVWTADSGGKVDYLNPRWMEYSGHPYEELAKTVWMNIIHPDDRDLAKDAWNTSMETGKHFEVENRLRRADGVYHWHLCRGTPKTDEHGRIVMWVGTSTDIEDQKRQLQKQDEFIGVASHELKTPLTSLKAYIQLLEQRLAETKPDTASLLFVEKANNLTDKLNRLIADLLDTSKIHSGKLALDISEFDFDTFISEVVEDFKYSTGQHRINLTGKANTMIKGDRHRLEQVMTNLLDNAIKYSPRSSRINVTVSGYPNEVQVAVQDFGIGIPPGLIDKIFERFYRGIEMSHTKISGLGIGLFISNEIVKRHNGKMWVESEYGKGSTFHFSIPVKHN